MLLQDLRFAFRALIRRPAYATVTLLTLALGLGANIFMFSLVRAVLLRPLPFEAPERLVQIFTRPLSRPDGTGGAISAPDYLDFRDRNRALADVAAFNPDAFALTGPGLAPEQIDGARVTGSFFRTFGVEPMFGRTINPDDDAESAADVVVLGEAIWRRRFGGDPAVVGSAIVIDGVAHRVVGIMPASFDFPLGSRLWAPQRFSPEQLATQRGAHYLSVVGRLAPGATLDVARAELAAIAAQLGHAYPKTNRLLTATVHDLRDAVVGDLRQPLLFLLAAVGVVLLIVCVNVAGLVLARTLGRSRELAIHAALGAGRLRLVRGPLMESLLLAAGGSAMGLALTWWAGPVIRTWPELEAFPLLDRTRVDLGVVVFATAVAAVCALLVGAIPAWHASGVHDIARQVRFDSPNATADPRRQRAGSLLVVAEIGLAVMLLVGAGLLLRSFAHLSSVDLGLQPSQVQTFNITLPEMRYDTPARRAAFVRDLTARASTQPDVTAAAAIFGLPLTGFRFSISTSTLDGRTLTDDEQDQHAMQVRVVTPDYFRVMGIPIAAGRAFGDADRTGAPTVAVLNRTAAQRYWPGVAALGHEFTLGTTLGQGLRAGGTVIGVVGDVRDFGPVEPVRPTVYLAHAQFPMAFVSVVVRTRDDPAQVVPSLRALLGSLDPAMPMFDVRAMPQRVATATQTSRLLTLMLGAFAVTAIVLASLGLYGTLAQLVTSRRREIGVRLALGATRRQIITLVAGRAVRVTAVGLTLGMAAAIASARAMQGLLHGVRPIDASTYLVVGGVLAASALLATWLPARRAARLDPVKVLRAD